MTSSCGGLTIGLYIPGPRPPIIEAGSNHGWHSFDQSIIEAYKAGKISEETAITSCSNKGKMRRELDLIHRQRGGKTEPEHSGLKLNIPEPIRIIEEAPAAATPPPLAIKRQLEPACPQAGQGILIVCLSPGLVASPAPGNEYSGNGAPLL